MTRAMLAVVMVPMLAVMSACMSIPPLNGDIIIEAKTPIVVLGKWNTDKSACALALEFDNKTVVVWTTHGCGVVHQEVVVPSYHDEDGGRPR